MIADLYMKATGIMSGSNIVVCILPVVKQQIACSALIHALLIDFRHAPFEGEREIVVLVKMPGHTLLRVLGVGQCNSLQIDLFLFVVP